MVPIFFSFAPISSHQIDLHHNTMFKWFNLIRCLETKRLSITCQLIKERFQCEGWWKFKTTNSFAMQKMHFFLNGEFHELSTSHDDPFGIYLILPLTISLSLCLSDVWTCQSHFYHSIFISKFYHMIIYRQYV